MKPKRMKNLTVLGHIPTMVKCEVFGESSPIKITVESKDQVFNKAEFDIYYSFTNKNPSEFNNDMKVADGMK